MIVAGTATATWLLYVLSQGTWIPMGEVNRFPTEKMCMQKLERTKMDFDGMNIHTNMEMRCRPEGWDGKDANDLEI